MYLCIPVSRRPRRMSFTRACPLAVPHGSGGIVYVLGSGVVPALGLAVSQSDPGRRAYLRVIGVSQGLVGAVLSRAETPLGGRSADVHLSCGRMIA